MMDQITPMQYRSTARNRREPTQRAAWIMSKVCFSKVRIVNRMDGEGYMRKVLALIGLMVFLAFSIQAQVPVALAPSMHPQFLDSSGKVLAGGFVYTYAAGTTTRQDTYTDSTGSIINAWPIPLDATGSPSNASGAQTGIWLSNQSYKFCAQNSALVQQWCVDNVSAYQILNNIGNITFGSVTSDPTGSAGEIGYRSDIPCFRFFSSFWDCGVTLTGIQSLTNKSATLDANTIHCASDVAGQYARDNGTKLVCANISQSDVTISIPNNGVFGTLLNSLAKISGATGTVQYTTTSDTGGVIGIVTAGNGLSGSATIQSSGLVNCAFDASTTAGDYVQISTTQTGGCHDTGSTYPTSGQVIGRVLSTNVGLGTYQIYEFGPEIKSPANAVAVTPANTTGLSANVSSTALLTPSANGFYRITCYLVVTQAASVSSTLPNCNVIYTDADSSVAQTITITNGSSGNTLGLTAPPSGTGLGIYAKSGISISYSTSSYASSGATPMLYALHLRLEGPF